MAKQAPNPIDVQDFQFKLHCRLKVFANEDNTVFNKPCSLLATASRFGLIFVGTDFATFQVIQVNNIESHTVKDGEITNYSRRAIALPSPPKHLSVNCDNTKLAVVVEKHGCPVGLIYDVASFLKQECTAFTEIRLSATPGANVIETSWNPSIPNIFTACKDDGTLGLYELKETGIDINELPAEARASCMCWSPKGKQIAVGSLDGRITQYKPDLKAMKVVNAPALEGPHSVVAIQWISNYQFIAMYKPQNADGGASLLVIDSPKTGDTVYTNYEDICYSYGNIRSVQFYMVHQAIWNILMVASGNSMEVGVLGSENEHWTQWILADAARAELPLSTSKQETMPVGLTFNTSAVEPVLWGEASLPPAPFLLLLSHHGLLCCFRVINIKSGVTTICQAPEQFADTSGLNQFTNVSSVVNVKIPIVEPQKQITPAALLPKPTAVSVQPSLPLSTHSFTSPQLPQVPLFTTPPPAPLFGAQPTLAASKPESVPSFHPDVPQPSLLGTKPVSQNLYGSLVQQQQQIASTPITTAPPVKPLPVATPVTISAPIQTSEANIVQEEADLLIAKLVREECEALEAELKALLHKGRSLKIDLGTDTEAVELVRGTDLLQDFLKEITETNAAQGAEVHALKQGLIQTWAWYEDARSRFAQTQDATLEALLRIQQLDPVSQRYLADIQHMTYYMESQLMQASRALDEQWENFQDSCKKIMRLKIPTMEAIYQTMVRQSVVHQKQKYVLKDLSSRIRAHRSKINGPSLFVSLNDADQLEKELRRLQLEPQHLLQAQYERVLQNQQRLTASKVQKLSKLLYEREVTRVTVNKPQLSNTSLQTLIQSSVTLNPQVKADSSQLLGAALSPIFASKPAARMVDFTQSTPKIIPSAIPVEQKQISGPVGPAEMDFLKGLPPGISIKFTSSAPIGTATPVAHGHLPSSTPLSTATKPESSPTAVPLMFKFATIPSTSVSTLSSPNSQTVSNQTSNAAQLNFSFAQFSTASKVNSVPASVTITPIPQGSSGQLDQSGLNTSLSTTKPFSSLFGTTKSASTFNFTFSASSTASTVSTQSSNAKPLASTASSAFVPTTQLGFNFSAKSAASTVPSSVVTSSTLPNSSAFVFGTVASATVTPSKAVIASDPSKVVTANSTMASNLSTAPSTATVTVVASATSTATAPIFGLFKTPNTAQTATPALSVFKTPNSEAGVQGAATPKPVLSVPAIQQSTAVSTAALPLEASLPSAVNNANSDSKIVTVAQSTVSSSQGSFFSTVPTAGTQSSLFNFSNAVAKTIQSFTASSTTTSITSTSSAFGGAVSSTTSGKTNENVSAASIFAKAAEASSSIFGAVPSAKSGSPFSTEVAATTSGSIFDATPTASSTSGSIFAATPTSTTSASIFGAAAAAPPSPFGSTATTTTSGSLFSQATAAPASASIFGSIPAPQSSTPSLLTAPGVATPTTAFGSTGATAATTAVSVFSPTTTTTSSSGFSTPVTTASSSFGVPASTLASSVFGATPASPGFGTSTTPSVFGQPVTTAAPSVFAAATNSVFGGAPKTTSGPFGSPAFPSSNASSFVQTASGSLFAQPAAFGSGSVFGAPVSSSPNTFASTAPTSPAFGSSGSVFGAPNTAPSDFGQTQSSSFSFAAAAANVPSTNSAFGFSKPAPFGFAAAPAATDASSFSFGNLNVGAATTTANTAFGSGFGQTANSNPFAKVGAQEQKPAFGGGSLFGTPPSTTTASIFGGGSSSGFGSPSSFGSPSGFGSPSTFGQQPAFAQTSYGNSFGSPSQPGPFSGGNQSVAQSGFGAFGQAQKPQGFSAPPVFGGSPSGFGAPPAFGSPASPGFGTAPSFGSPTKVFGGSASPTGTFAAAAPQQQNPTFANLATQNTLGFGALAQQTQPNQSSSPFSGGSSFSTWR